MRRVGFLMDVACVVLDDPLKAGTISLRDIRYPHVAVATDPVGVMPWLPVGVNVEQPSFDEADVVVAQYRIVREFRVVVVGYGNKPALALAVP